MNDGVETEHMMKLMRENMWFPRCMLVGVRATGSLAMVKGVGFSGLLIFSMLAVAIMTLPALSWAKSAPKTVVIKTAANTAAAKTVTFTFKPAPKGTINSTRTREKKNHGKMTKNVGKMKVPFKITASKTGHIVESVVESFSATVDGKQFEDPMIQSMVGLKTQLHVDNEVKATHVTGLEVYKRKILKVLDRVPKEMRAQIEPRMSQMTTGAKDIGLWNQRYYQFAGEKLGLEVPMVRDDSLPHPMGGNINAVHTVVIHSSSACPTKQCVLIENVTEADPKSLAKVMEGIMARMFDNMKDMMKKKGNTKKPPKLKFGASKMIATTKILMDPSTMTVFKIDFFREVDMDMGDLGHSVMRETHDDRYIYPTLKK